MAGERKRRQARIIARVRLARYLNSQDAPAVIDLDIADAWIVECQAASRVLVRQLERTAAGRAALAQDRADGRRETDHVD